MSHDETVVPPPVPAGAEGARPRDAWRLTWWTLRGWGEAAGNRSLPPVTRILLAVLTVTGVVCYLLAVLINAALMLSSRRFTYLTTAHDVTAAVVAHKGRRWHLEDHSRAKGANGKDLRALLFPLLTQTADQHNVTITMTASSPRLAQIYRAEMPGLEVVGQAFPFGVKLQRRPAR